MLLNSPTDPQHIGKVTDSLIGFQVVGLHYVAAAPHDDRISTDQRLPFQVGVSVVGCQDPHTAA